MEFLEEDIENARKFFSGTSSFVKSVVSLKSLPDQNSNEVAFFGRSNVGKSSLINAITKKKNLARYSKTPGRTKELNFFKIENNNGNLFFVDLPGYGYAKVSKKEQRDWKKLILNYFIERRNLRTVFLLIDVRRNLSLEDKKIMNFFDKLGLGWSLVLTKIDKLSKAELEKKLIEFNLTLKSRIAAFPYLFNTSSKKKTGLNELRAYIYTFVNN